jgi:uroporphyrinogen decarboxylase
MTPMENLRRLRNGGSAEWIPFTLDVGAVPGFTKPVLERFRRETGADQPEEFFDYDYRTVSLETRFGGENPAALHAVVEPGTVFDEWGGGHLAGTTEGATEKTFPALATATGIGDVESLPVPIIESGDEAGRIAAYQRRGYPVFGYGGSVYEWSWWLRGMEQFMVDLMADPEMAEAVLDKVSAHTKRLALASAKAGMDVLCFYDDAGMQSGMQIAPETWRRFIKPRWREILTSVRKQYPETMFFLHSCGKIHEIIPDIIEIGFDILHPIQPECLDINEVFARHGHEIILCGCISAQKTFPFGSPDDVRDYVRGLKKLFAQNNRGLLFPSNMIQPETPWENILAFVEEAKSKTATHG